MLKSLLVEVLIVLALFVLSLVGYAAHNPPLAILGGMSAAVVMSLIFYTRT